MTCNKLLQAEGKSYPRTCPDCGLGPCKGGASTPTGMGTHAGIMTMQECADAESAPSALAKQVNGDHYKKLRIQPIEFIHANSIPFAEGCAIKYLCRWRDKGGLADLEKAKHFIELLIELESKGVER